MKKSKIYQQEFKDWEKGAQFHQFAWQSPFRQFLSQKILATYHLSRKEKTILEIGCGTGLFTTYLSQKRKKVTGVDFSPKMLKVAKEKNPKTTFVLTSAEKLPFKKNSFDVVVANMTLHHLKAQGLLTASLKQIHRVLKLKGIFCVFEHQDSLPSRLLLGLFSLGQNLFLKIRGDLSSSGSQSEIIFAAKDIQTITNQGFTLLKKGGLVTVFFRLLEAIANTFGYLLGQSIGVKTAVILFPLAKWFEEKLNLDCFSTEQCLKFRKR